MITKPWCYRYFLVAFIVAVLLPMHVIYADHVYKWVDEKGQIHYGEKEPANLSIEKITIEQPPPVDESLQHQRMEKQKKLLESFDKNRAAEKEKKEQDKAAREVKRQYCEDARRHLRFLEQADGARLARPSETGDIHWVSDVEREMLIEHWRNRVQTLCK